MHHPIQEDLEERLDRAIATLRSAREVAVLTGAGISAESGVATFRGAGGLWEGHRITDVATPQAFERNPGLVWRFYNLRRAALRAVRPNPGHRALAVLEAYYTSACFTVVTQNIDGLHRAAGSHNVLEVHGNLARVRCTRCGQVEDRGLEPLPDKPKCSACSALLRPDVVWFGEMLPEDVWRAACVAVARCQSLLVVGTSALVFPAAGLIDAAHAVGASVVEINLEATAASAHRNVLGLYGPSGDILPRLVEGLGLLMPPGSSPGANEGHQPES
jgi:NAD-dependent deacetylase